MITGTVQNHNNFATLTFPCSENEMEKKLEELDRWDETNVTLFVDKVCFLVSCPLLFISNPAFRHMCLKPLYGTCVWKSIKSGKDFSLPPSMSKYK